MPLKLRVQYIESKNALFVHHEKGGRDSLYIAFSEKSCSFARIMQAVHAQSPRRISVLRQKPRESNPRFAIYLECF